MFIFMLGAITAGMAGRALFPDLTDSETVRADGGEEERLAALTGGEYFTALFDATGSLEVLRVLDSLGHGLDEAAVEAAVHRLAGAIPAAAAAVPSAGAGTK